MRGGQRETLGSSAAARAVCEGYRNYWREKCVSGNTRPVTSERYVSDAAPTCQRRASRKPLFTPCMGIILFCFYAFATATVKVNPNPTATPNPNPPKPNVNRLH